MLGELYTPKGMALETAQAVFPDTYVLACNVALGCPNNCSYCYGSLATRQSKKRWLVPRLPKKPPVELIRKQLTEELVLSMVGQKGIFLSFLTDPFLDCNRENTENLISFLVKTEYPCRIATLSKLGISNNRSDLIRHGLSIVSLDEEFRRKFEPNTLRYQSRLRMLCLAHELSYSWASLEPYPPSEIWPQKLEPLLDELKFWGIDLIVFGKWNYDKRAKTEQARQEYREHINVITDFCKTNKIRLHIKSDTRKFCEKVIS